jgi:peroxiredoxin Q/BCP|tara:strand:+ start:466 stop:915 length:450 start_codon:yes stop_codon:yes gene_type:complete
MAKVGDKIPDFQLKNEQNEMINIADYKEQPMVIYFYPKDDTPGCTKEACSFRDSFQDFTDAGVSVFGISADSPKSHEAFKAKYRLPYTLLSDADNKVRKAFKVPTDLFGLMPGRVTYVIDKTGTIRHVFKSQFKVEEHVTEALDVIRTL